MRSTKVPFRPSGPAANQEAPDRFFQIGTITMNIKQCSQKANALRVPGHSSVLQDGEGDGDLSGVQWPHDTRSIQQGPGIQMQPLGPQQDPALVNVGMVVWQSGFVLAELLLRRPEVAFGPWPGVKVLDLGAGTGVTGIALALAGASVLLTDLPHILPLTQENVAGNCRPAVHKAHVAEYQWGTDATSMLQQCGGYPDVIIAADCIYEVQFHEALMATLHQCMASHSVAFFSFRRRTAKEQSFATTAAAHGFAVELVPEEIFHEDYQSGEYCVLRLARIDGPVEQGGPLLVGANTSRHVTSSRRHLSQGRACDTRLQVDTSLEAEDEEQEEPEHKPCSQS